MQTRISILGCGWLGLPLAESLTRQGYQVKGSTTTPEKLPLLNDKGIKAYLLNLSQPNTLAELPDFLETDILIVCFPPRLRANQGESYLQQINILADALKQKQSLSIIFVSSTSVYPDISKTYTEDEDLTATLPQNKLLQAEILISSINKKTTIVRFAGLVGASRHPGRFFAGKENVINPDAPVNLIHLADCIQILEEIIRQNKWGNIYNACSDLHPTRQDFYTSATKALRLQLPHFASESNNNTYKIISNVKLKKELYYEFIYPDPMLILTDLS